MSLHELIFLGGLLHLPILAIALMIPQQLGWSRALAVLDPFLRRLFWVYGAFIALVIAGFAALCLLLAPCLAADDALARSVCGFIALFWWLRLFVQLAVFDPAPLLTSRLRRIGYHLLTLLFVAQAVLFTQAAGRFGL